MKAFFFLAMLAFLVGVNAQSLNAFDGGSAVSVSYVEPDKEGGAQMAVDFHGEHRLSLRLTDGETMQFIRDTATGNYRRANSIVGTTYPADFPETQPKFDACQDEMSPTAATGLIAGPDSLAIPIPVTLPATLHYSNLSHTNTTTTLGAAIMYSTNGGATWSNPTVINGGASHASLWQGTVFLKVVAGKLVISCTGSTSSPNASFYTTTWVLNSPNAPITHVKLGTAMTFPAGLKLDGGGVYVLE